MLFVLSTLQVLETICIDPDEFQESVEKKNLLDAHHFHINEATATKPGGNGSQNAGLSIAPSLVALQHFWKKLKAVA